MNSLEITVKDFEGKDLEKLILKRVKRNNLTKLIELQKILLEDFIYFNASIGSLVSNPSSWKNLEKICTLIPVVPNSTLGDYINILEDDIDLLTKLFFTNSWDSEKEEYVHGNSFEPSLISKLNRLDYTGDLGKGILKSAMRKEKELQEYQEVTKPQEENSNP